MQTGILFKRQWRIIALASALLASGCASEATKEEVRSDSRDPIESWNRGAQFFNDKLDDYIMKPLATGYHTVTPSAVDQGVTNFYSNIDDIGVIANDLLQLKLAQGGKDFGRFLVNTTVGMAGFVDVASKMNLTKHNEDFDQTLGKWGVPTGPYLVLPILGPSTPRGILGIAGDVAANPVNWINPMVGYGFGTAGWHFTDAIIFGSGFLRQVDQRADLLSASKIMDEAAVDRYEFIRNAYFQQREFEVHDGAPPLDAELEKQLDEDLESIGKETAPVAPAPAGKPL